MNQQDSSNSAPQHPGKVLRQKMEERGWTQDDLALIVGKSRQAISEIVSGKNGIGLEMATLLAAAFGNSPQDWLKIDQSYRLWMIDQDTGEVQQMSALFAAAPVREMVKRGWIGPAKTANELRAELTTFFESDPIEQGISLPVATRRTMKLPSLTPAEIAWCFRARQLARSLLVEPFSADRLPKAKSALRRLATHPKEARHVPRTLAEYGIRFVIVEPIPGVKIDGAALWDEIGPIIALSLRHDRIDGFWFTLMHEFEHIQNEDPISVDCGMVDGMKGVTVSLVNDIAEDKANAGAAAALVPAPEMDSFIRRVGPFYPKDRVVQFANRIRIHPGIIVGQLQHREELGYMALREFMAKIRQDLIATALTDGWGHSTSPALTRSK